MVSSFSRVAVTAAFTSFLSCPSASCFQRSAPRRYFGLWNYQHDGRNQKRFVSTAFSSSLRTTRNAGRTQEVTRSVSSSAASMSQPAPLPQVDFELNTNSQNNRARDSLGSLITASRKGLDPSENRFHPPLVYHDGYSSVPDWPPKHTFPMMKFERICHALLTTTSKSIAASNLPRPLVRSKDDFYGPPDFSGIPIEEWLDLLKNESVGGDNDSSPSADRKISNGDASNESKTNDSFDTTTTTTTTTSTTIPPQPDFARRFLRGELTSEEARIIGFREQTHRPELVERTVLEVAGTVLTAQLALKHGIAANLAGGTHHAHPSGGAGYTILNDLAITANLLTKASLATNNSTDNDYSAFGPNGRVERVLVIDCDVHQGDGTAQYSTLWEKDRRLFTLSIHCESNYPFLKHNSTYDVGLHDRCNDEEYLDALKTSVDKAISEVRPDLVLYDAGVDVYLHDKLGRLDLTEEDGIRQRDRWVLDRCVSLGIPVAAVVGGGYDKDLDALGRRHAIVHEECAYVWRKHKLWRRQ